MQLKELKNQMLLLGSMVEDVIQETIRALTCQDTKKAGEIASGDEKINEQVRKVEQQCYTILLRQQPIAKDLRAVSAALKMLTDMERIGDHGADISELTLLMSNSTYPGEIRLIEEMAKETSIMLIEAVDAFAQQDSDKAQHVIDNDDTVDRLFVSVKDAIARSIQTDSADPMQLLDLLMVAKYLERIGDHATNIAEWVLFAVTGDFRSVQ
ncbi:MAG: phosphate signaling complex protein PhoU [Eubacteriaceae bacterium]|nr:phosphate signaling complex protein PhoU [Eubacteriaceae bacterium]